MMLFLFLASSSVLIFIYFKKNPKLAKTTFSVRYSAKLKKVKSSYQPQAGFVEATANSGKARNYDAMAYSHDADDILSKVFEVACPNSNNCLEVLVLLERLTGKITPSHLKKLKLLFNVYGSNNHLFDAALIKIVSGCPNCQEKFELLEHIYATSRFYLDIPPRAEPYIEPQLPNKASASKGK